MLIYDTEDAIQPHHFQVQLTKRQRAIKNIEYAEHLLREKGYRKTSYCAAEYDSRIVWVKDSLTDSVLVPFNKFTLRETEDLCQLVENLK